jgi:hypothetical protein
MRRILIAALCCLLIAPSAAAAPALLSVRAVAQSDGVHALITWEAVPGAVLSCVAAPQQQPGICLPLSAPPRLVVVAAWGEPVSVTIRNEVQTLAVGAASVGPPPIYLPAVEVYQ